MQAADKKARRGLAAGIKAVFFETSLVSFFRPKNERVPGPGIWFICFLYDNVVRQNYIVCHITVMSGLIRATRQLPFDFD